jgi:hypothetical protein
MTHHSLPYQEGASAFRRTLMDLASLHASCIADVGDFDPSRFVPVLRHAFDEQPDVESADGFWHAFGAWLSQTLEGVEIDLQLWDVLRDLDEKGGEP